MVAFPAPSEHGHPPDYASKPEPNPEPEPEHQPAHEPRSRQFGEPIE
jgi:hypothetical protein